MTSATAITAAFACFALVTAIFHLWLFSLRPRERTHLWIGVFSIGVAWVAAGCAATYEAQTLAEAQRAQRIAFFGSLPLVVGFLRFTAVFLHIQIPRLEIASGLYAAASSLAAAFFPDPLFSGRAISLTGPSGETYLVAALAPSAAFFLAGFALVIPAVIHLYLRHRYRIQGGPLLPAALVTWCLFMASDLCVAFGVYRAPWLLGLGFVVFASAFGAILLARLVRSLAKVERSSAQLHQLVEERTGELRRKDLELAHGARLATLGALAGGIAHEVEQPLAAITRSVKELRGAWRDETRPGAFHALLRDAQAGVERIRALVAEMLQLARRGEGRQGEHDLATIVAGVLPIAGYELRRRSRFETHLAAGPRVRGDAAMLSQIALNLLVGAMGAFDERRPPESCRIHVTTGELDGRALLEVEDSAPARSGDLAPHLFDGAQAPADEGTRRLGLAITSQLARRHGGSLEVESGPGGTRVRVLLPAAAPEALGA